MPCLFVEERGQNTAEFSNQANSARTANRNRAHISTILINGSVQCGRVIVLRKQTPPQVPGIDLLPILKPGNKEHLPLSWNPQRKAVFG